MVVVVVVVVAAAVVVVLVGHDPSHLKAPARSRCPSRSQSSENFAACRK